MIKFGDVSESMKMDITFKKFGECIQCQYYIIDNLHDVNQSLRLKTEKNSKSLLFFYFFFCLLDRTFTPNNLQ